MSTDYNNWAWLYNQTMGPEYSQPQLDFLRSHFLPHLPQGAKVLDLCCGTGQLISPLLAAGYQVTGLDSSDEMLTYAHKNAPAAEYICADACTFNLSQPVDGIFSTSASLNHIMTMEDLAQVFSQSYANLSSGGLLAFDLNHPQQLARWWHSQPTEGEIDADYAWMITPNYNSAASEGDFTVTIYQAPQSANGAITSWHSAIRQRLYQLLSRPRFIGLRLKLIQNFHWLEPSWVKKELVYPVKGHNLEAVKQALQVAGFAEVSMLTIDGSAEIDSNHSAHFIAKKPRQKEDSLR
ncbi:MAG: class I SAM-dependent methyltransferase [Cyanobacteria bacterium J06627_28]